MLVTYLEASRYLCETDSILFGATLAVCRIIGAKLPMAGRATQQSSAIPAWRKRIEDRIAKARALICRLTSFRSGNNRPRVVRTVRKAFAGTNISLSQPDIRQKLTERIDDLKQKIAAWGKRIRRFSERSRRFNENCLFQSDQKRLYKSLVRPEPKTEESVKRGLSNKCVARQTSSCLAIELVGYMDKILKTASFQLTDDIMIVDESNGTAAKMPVPSESLARAGTSLEDKAQQIIMNKLWNFATTRSLRYRLLNNADVVISGKQEKDGSFDVGVSMKAPKAFETGRAKNKNMGTLLAAAAMKFGLLGALTFKGLYLIVGKALLISKIALLLATIIGLKKLISPQTGVAVPGTTIENH
ncbi:unnamed protein product [Parnassius apollo]|uniref:(apollo) hypothetical protein n=1 Tax=Parnassius apollo TaxID=110799 RepID=A0A8S3WLA2_PARAO|nr:unnamed protein product [Parnassius apollo]